MVSITTLSSWDTELSADSVEWCPLPPCQDYFVCGTYQLEVTQNTGTETNPESNPEQKKYGRLYLLRFNSENKIEVLEVLAMPAVLDSKWCHKKIQGKILLCVANEAGYVVLYELKNVKLGDGLPECKPESDGHGLYKLTELSICTPDTKGVLALSLDWSTGRSTDNPHVCVSDSRGIITLAQLKDDTLEVVQQWKAHNAEAWITAFDYWNSNVIYTGGDDCKFHTFDLRCGVSQPTVTNKSHETGVTSLHCNAMHPNTLASGSYDETLRLWDTRNTRQPISSLPLGGGIWRVKWDPYTGEHIVAACIYGGFRVVQSKRGCLQLLGEYEGEHTSIAYGADWCHAPSPKQDDSFLISTCSFYDHMLCVSAVRLYKDDCVN
ncbi:diphthine methyltransferase isoform X2 [Schistocerca nitens]|nr:diphthine methyltransferase isoform X2 [Schistocerca nitens]XP_049803652.1 diphthine methyltransferase isoform X2 [Schistocerca nitens]XP_049803653.1 diphthine methyltransferase isoform X2 [Schistocerca nitens]XP_049803654.1 diphthine methyltransferase isoform X2 [Schistocerca nitens]XP_049803655.1 diphthine methyltransferase isoform X2 [Schistocerca nitens]